MEDVLEHAFEGGCPWRQHSKLWQVLKRSYFHSNYSATLPMQMRIEPAVEVKTKSNIKESLNAVCKIQSENLFYIFVFFACQVLFIMVAAICHFLFSIPHLIPCIGISLDGKSLVFAFTSNIWKLMLIPLLCIISL